MINDISQIMFLTKFSHNNINTEYIESIEQNEVDERVVDIQKTLLDGDYCCMLCGGEFDVFPSAEVFKEHWQQCCDELIRTTNKGV